MYKRLVATALVLGTLAAAPPALAQNVPACGPRDQIVSMLEGRFDEARKGAGLANAKALIEVWTSAATGTFTVLSTNASGTSCIIATGNTWLDDRPQPIGDPV